MPPQNTYSVTPPPHHPQSTTLKTRIEDTAIGVFIGSVFLLTIVSVLGIWEVFHGNVMEKSLETMGLLAIVSLVVLVAARYVGSPEEQSAVPVPRPAYRATRNITLATLIVSAALLAFVGVLSIWDVITDREVLEKSVASLALIAFSSFVIVLTCLHKEQNPFWKQHKKSISGWSVFGFVVLAWVFLAFIGAIL